ncbi:flagellar protein FlaF [Methanosarcina sp. KYL-1]|uniref:flagellar protein FlaF n=1 Tax=Methanosarcina sp. KYL-1 TaxID=2602068 RepID=UPI002101797B|nr:flagellar protein FlaF [Methanosarcina sp. KYL-1]MCQ1535938.1 flagellar protein FlaF [Methanosarcina sp. KYL-1]
MGLDTVIVAFFVVGMILVVAGTVTMGTSNLLESSYEGYAAIQETTMDRLHTNIEITNIWNSSVDPNRISIMVNNTGETKLNNFGLWDIIVVKDGQVFYLKTNNENITFYNDHINPKILDPNEYIKIEFDFPVEFSSTDHLIVKIITENGITSSTEYVVP